MEKQRIFEDHHPAVLEEHSISLLKGIDFCVFDLETTGGNHNHDKIIEIGLIKIQNLKIIKKKHFLINPEIKIPDFIQKLTSISQSDVESCPKIHEVIQDILDFMGNSVLVAHNTSFDVPFFNSVLRRLNLPERKNRSICTNLMTKNLIPNLLNSNLNYMSRIFAIKHAKAHRALDDALATAELLIHFLNIFIKKGITKVNHLYYPRNKFELDKIHIKKQIPRNQIKKDLSEIKMPFLISIKGKNGIILFSIPCANSPKEQDLLIEKLNTLEWEVITIKLFGTLFEAIVSFSSIFSKFKNELKTEILNLLENEFLNESSKKRPQNELKGEFLVIRHLVPEQFIVYPLFSLHKKSGLIFRYPGHKKKLLQYAKSKYAKFKKNKHKKNGIDPQIKTFLMNLIQQNIENSENILLFDGASLAESTELLEKLDSFSSVKQNDFNFPLEYIY
tara:strand:- start:475 stop:1815 length:1341 start_codon:yes stop_codon:yes gene_type:complete